MDVCAADVYWVNTIRPPNRENCQSHNTDGREGTNTAASRHQGGAHVMFADGAVKFVTDNIEAGDQTVGITLGAKKVRMGFGVPWDLGLVARTSSSSDNHS